MSYSFGPYTKKECQIIHEHCCKYSIAKEVQYGISYQYQGIKCTIYNTGKVLVQGKNELLQTHPFLLFFQIPKQDKTTDSSIPIINSNVIGGDESGKGDYFGGIVCVIVQLSSELFEKINDDAKYSWIQDSKNLTDHRIQQLIPSIFPIIEGHYWVKSLNVQEYQLQYNKFQNINKILAFTYNELLLSIDTKTKQKIIIDGFCKITNYHQHLTQIQDMYPNLIKKIVPIDNLIPKGEGKYKTIALASMLARYFYLQQIALIQKELQRTIPLGNTYNTSVSSSLFNWFAAYDLTTSQRIMQQYCKKHFKTTTIIIQQLY